jgi:hypothetical protein
VILKSHLEKRTGAIDSGRLSGMMWLIEQPWSYHRLLITVIVVYHYPIALWVEEAVKISLLVVQIEGSNMVDLLAEEPPLTCFDEVTPPGLTLS